MCKQWEKEKRYVAVVPNLPVAVLLGSDVHAVSKILMASFTTTNAQTTELQLLLLPDLNPKTAANIFQRSLRLLDKGMLPQYWYFIFLVYFRFAYYWWCHNSMIAASINQYPHWFAIHCAFLWVFVTLCVPGNIFDHLGYSCSILSFFLRINLNPAAYCKYPAVTFPLITIPALPGGG